MLLGAIALAVGGFLAAYWVSLADPANSIDGAVLRALRDPENPGETVGPAWLHRFMGDVTVIAGWPFLTVLAALAGAHLALMRRWTDAGLIVCAMTLNAVAVEQMKLLFARARPDLVPHLGHYTSFSFPSGHAASAAAVYLILAGILAREAAAPQQRILIWASAAGLVFLGGASRVFLGVHFPSDVIAGWCWGAAFAALALHAANWLRSRKAA